MSALARLAIRHPLPLLAFWLIAFGLSFAIGRSSSDSLHTADLQISGTPADRAIKLSNEEFGGTIAMAVLLRDTGGDTRRVDREGPRIVRRLERIPGVRVLNPWGIGGTRTLREPPGQALLALQVLRPFEKISNETTPAVRRTLDRSVRSPLRADLVGSAPTSREINDSILKSLRRGELLALLLLIPLLLIVFRGVVAAIVPGISGVLTIVIGEALLGLLNNIVPIDAIALNILTILGLALGVDYSLLIVSRFREELAAGRPVAEAVETSIVKAGRTVLFAGLTLSAGMLVALLVLPGGVLVSGTLGVLVATVTAMAVALFALPAELALLGTNINRLPIGRTSSGGGFTGLALRAMRKPGIAAALVALPLVLLCTPAIALDSRPPNFDQLPEGNRLRIGAEDFEANRPGGWIGPFEVTFHTRGAVTTRKRLRALNRFQNKMVRTDGVAAVLGPSPLLRYSRQLDNLTAQLSSGTEQSRKLEAALIRVLRATGELRDGLEAGAQGSDQLVNGLELAQGGASTLNQSVLAAEPGTQQLADGVKQTGNGAGRAADASDEIEGRAKELRDAVNDAQSALGPVPGQVDSAITQQDNALRALSNSSPEAQADPQVQSAIASLQALGTSLQSIKGDAGTNTGVSGATNDVLQASEAARKVANGLARLTSGLGRLDDGIDKTASGASQVADGVSQLAGGTGALDSGLGLLLNGPSGNDGARALSAGLNEAAAGTNELGRGIQRLLDGVVEVRQKAQRQNRKLNRRGIDLAARLQVRLPVARGNRRIEAVDRQQRLLRSQYRERRQHRAGHDRARGQPVQRSGLRASQDDREGRAPHRQADARDGAGRRPAGARQRLRPLDHRPHPAAGGDAGAGHVPAAAADVPLAVARRLCGRAQPAHGRRGDRHPDPGLPGRLTDPRRARISGRALAERGLRDHVRVVDRLRGVPDQPSLGGSSLDRHDRRRDRARTRQDRHDHHRRGGDHDRRLHGVRAVTGGDHPPARRRVDGGRDHRRDGSQVDPVPGTDPAVRRTHLVGAGPARSHPAAHHTALATGAPHNSYYFFLFFFLVGFAGLAHLNLLGRLVAMLASGAPMYLKVARNLALGLLQVGWLIQKYFLPFEDLS